MFVLQTLFPIICSMSLIGGIVIILVLLVRLPFRRLPKIFSYLLWSVVLLRLLCPFTFSSHLSVFQVIGNAAYSAKPEYRFRIYNKFRLFGKCTKARRVR